MKNKINYYFVFIIIIFLHSQCGILTRFILPQIQENIEKDIELRKKLNDRLDSTINIVKKGKTKITADDPEFNYLKTLEKIKNDNEKNIKKLKETNSDMKTRNYNKKEIEEVLKNSEILKEELEKDIGVYDQVNEHVKRGYYKIEEGDVFFAPGEWELSDEGKSSIKKYIQENKEFYLDKYSKGLEIKTIGYADSDPCKKGLQKKLLKKSGKNEPKENNEFKRKFYNQILSEFRAKSVADYIKISIKEIDNSIKTKDTKIIGQGEKFPPSDYLKNKKETSYKKGKDKNRRISVFSISKKYYNFNGNG